MCKILVIGGGDYQTTLIKRIRHRGYKAYCVDGNVKAPGFIYANDYRCIDVKNADECLAYAQELQIDGVATFGATITLPTVSYIGKKMNLPTINDYPATIAGNKYIIKKKLISEGCNNQGDLISFHTIEEALNYQAVYPCVVKPSDGSGSKGVSIVYSKHQYEGAIKEAFAAARFDEIYIEKYIDGNEFSVEVFVNNNAVYVYSIVKTSFIRKSASNSGISYGHTTPPGIDFQLEQTITNEIMNAVKALSVNMGSVNFDVIVSNDDNKPYIIDCGIRIGQNLIASHIVPFSRGVDELDMYISQVLGENVNPKPKYEKCVSTKLLIADPGRIKDIKPMQQFIGRDGIEDIVLRKKVGDIQRTYKEKSDNCGWVICSGRTPDESEKKAEEARKKLLTKIEIE